MDLLLHAFSSITSFLVDSDIESIRSSYFFAHRAHFSLSRILSPRVFVNFFFKGVDRRVCQVLLGGGGKAKKRSTPLPRGLDMRGREREKERETHNY